MPTAKTCACHNCKAVNPADYTFCFACRVPPKASAKPSPAKKTAAKAKRAPAAKTTTRKK